MNKFLGRFSAGGAKDTEDEYDVFLSWDRYTEGDAAGKVRREVEQLIKTLKAHGIKACGGPEPKVQGLEGEGAWMQLVKKSIEGVRKSSGVLVLLTEGYIASVGDWHEVKSAGNPLRMEFAVCVSQHSEGSGKIHPTHMVPVLMEDGLRREEWNTVATFLGDMKERTTKELVLIADDVERLRRRSRKRHSEGKGGGIIDLVQESVRIESVVIPAMMSVIKVEYEANDTETKLARQASADGGGVVAENWDRRGKDIVYIREVFQLASCASDVGATFEDTLQSCIKIKADMRGQEEDLQRRRDELEKEQQKMEKNLEEALEQRKKKRKAKSKERRANDEEIARNRAEIQRVAEAEQKLSELTDKTSALKEGDTEVDKQLKEKSAEFEALMDRQRELERKQQEFDDEMRRLEEEEEEEKNRIVREHERREAELKELERKKAELVEMEQQKIKQVTFNYDKWKEIKVLQKKEENQRRNIEEEDKGMFHCVL